MKRKHYTLREEDILANVGPDVEIDDVNLTISQDYIPEEDPELTQYSNLDTFKHASAAADLPPTNALEENPLEDMLNESTRSKKNSKYFFLREGKKSIITQYLDSTDSPKYSGLKSFVVDELGLDISDVPSNAYYLNVAKSYDSSGPEGDKKEPREEKTMDLSELGDEFSDIGEVFKAGVEIDLSPDMSVTERYDNLFSSVFSWASSPKSSWEAGTAVEGGFKRHLFICGNPGIGKSFTVLEAMKAAMRKGLDGWETQYVRGSIGSAKGDIMAFLNKFQRNHLIIFDDCDDFIDNPANDNIMKGILELDNPQTMTGSLGVKKRAATIDPLHNPLKHPTESTLMSFLSKDINPLYEKFIDEDVEDEGEDLEIPEEEDFPDLIEFRSRILFISNKRRDEINSAVRDRTTVTELALTGQEIVDRIGQLLSVFLAHETSVDADRLAWAKNNAYKWLKLGVKSAGVPINLPNGSQLRFPNLTAPGVYITFRNYIELVEQWVKSADVFEARNNVDLMAGETLPPNFIRMYLVSKMIPAFKDIAGDKKRK